MDFTQICQDVSYPSPLSNVFILAGPLPQCGYQVFILVLVLKIFSLKFARFSRILSLSLHPHLNISIKTKS